MAVRIVDAAEAVEVEAHHGQASTFAPLAAGVSQRLLETLPCQQAVGQSGQGIVVGQEVDQVLLGLALGDIEEQRHVVGDLPRRVAQGGSAEQAGIGFAILAPRQQLARPVAAFRHGLHHHAQVGGILFTGMQHGHIAAQYFLAGVAGNLREGGIGGDDARLGVGDNDGVAGGLDHLARQAHEFLVGAALLDLARQFGRALGHPLFERGAFLRQRVLGTTQAHVGVGAGQDFLGLERLGDEVHCAQGEAAHLVVGVMLGREEDDRHLAQFRRFLEAPAHFEAVDAGHADVEQDQFRRARLRGPQGQFAIGRLAHVVAGVGEQVAEELERGRRVFHDQHFTLGVLFR